MFNFNENDIQKAAYYIWKNNGCPANTSVQDWNAAINQLSAMAALKNNNKSAVLSSKKNSSSKSSLKTSACKTTSAAKKSSSLKAVSTKANVICRNRIRCPILNQNCLIIFYCECLVIFDSIITSRQICHITQHNKKQKFH